jgi:hypothetical protein
VSERKEQSIKTERWRQSIDRNRREKTREERTYYSYSYSSQATVITVPAERNTQQNQNETPKDAIANERTINDRTLIPVVHAVVAFLAIHRGRTESCGIPPNILGRSHHTNRHLPQIRTTESSRALPAWASGTGSDFGCLPNSRKGGTPSKPTTRLLKKDLSHPSTLYGSLASLRSTISSALSALC